MPLVPDDPFEPVVNDVPFKTREPVKKILPVNWCVSSRVLPNLVDPLSYKTDDETSSV